MTRSAYFYNITRPYFCYRFTTIESDIKHSANRQCVSDDTSARNNAFITCNNNSPLAATAAIAARIFYKTILKNIFNWNPVDPPRLSRTGSIYSRPVVSYCDIYADATALMARKSVRNKILKRYLLRFSLDHLIDCHFSLSILFLRLLPIQKLKKLWVWHVLWYYPVDRLITTWLIADKRHSHFMF